jgi:hypothetical protein
MLSYKYYKDFGLVLLACSLRRRMVVVGRAGSTKKEQVYKAVTKCGRWSRCGQVRSVDDVEADGVSQNCP